MNPAPGNETSEPLTDGATPSQSGGTSLMDVLLVLAARWRLLLCLPLSVGLLVLALAFQIAPVFTARTQLLPPQQQSSTAAALLGSLGGIAGGLGASVAGLKNPTDQWIGLLKSRVVADAIVDKFSLQTLYKSKYRFEARNRLAANTLIGAGRDGLIVIEVDDHSPERAAQIARAYIDELRRLTATLAVTEAAQRRVFFEKQLKDTKDNLVRAEVALRAGGIGADVLKTNPTAAVAKLAQAQAAIAAQEVRVSVLRGTLTENNPDLIQAVRQLDSLRQQLRLAEQASTSQQDGGADYVARYREFKYYETLFDLFARQYEAARADEARDGSLVQVVDEAQVPEHKSKPGRAMLAMLATVITLTGCVAYLLLRNAYQRYRQRPGGSAKLAALRQAVRRRRVAQP